MQTELILWDVLPYIALTILVGATIWRYQTRERSWTTKSSQFLEKKQLKFAGPLFHLGLAAVLGGHFGGVIVPKALTEAFGVSEEMYHMGAVMAGIPAGFLLTGTFVWLLVRRLGNRKLLCANTSAMDLWLYAFLGLAIFSGLLATLTNDPGSGFNYRDTVSPWFRSLFMLQPDGSLLLDIPFFFKLHMVSWMAVAVVFPFSRLVHCLSLPLGWLWRSPILYRRRQ